jgi:hypothetical protein
VKSWSGDEARVGDHERQGKGIRLDDVEDEGADGE